MMINTNVVSREAVENAKDEIIRTLNYINSSGRLDYADYCELFDTIEREFDALKSVPHEMSAREFFPKWFEICNTYLSDDCYHCPLYLRTNHRKFTPSCMYLMMTDSEEAISIVEEWAREHPEERSDE